MIDNSWDSVWRDFSGLNFFGKIMFYSKEKVFRKALKIFIPKDYSVIDVGCGSGNVLKIFRKLGYKNSIGIDPSEHAIRLCVQQGFERNKDIFRSDSKKWKRKHDVVWSDGLLEHYGYVDMKDIAEDFVKMSKQFIGFVQPNPHSVIGKFMSKSQWEWERPYEKEIYIKVFENLGCDLLSMEYINFKEQILYLFEIGTKSALSHQA